VVENSDGKAVEGLVGRLCHDCIHNSELRVVAKPVCDFVAELVPILRHGRGEDLDPVEVVLFAGRVAHGFPFAPRYVPHLQALIKGGAVVASQ